MNPKTIQKILVAVGISCGIIAAVILAGIVALCEFAGGAVAVFKNRGR